MDLIPLNAGPLSAVFDPHEAMLRYIRFGDIEVVRGVYAAVRDRDWNTVPLTVHGLNVDSFDDRFRILLFAECRAEAIRFHWRGELVGTELGSIRISFDGQAQNAFHRNRIGLCVLHPDQPCAGTACRVQHVDGQLTEGVFPELISPHQPFKQMRSITHRVTDNAEVCVTMEGDTFEMEDQRNWTDASFKTYSTPLELPFPQEVPSGTSIKQSVSIDLKPIQSTSDRRKAANAAAAEDRGPVTVEIDWDKRHLLPSIGLLMADRAQPVSEQIVRQLSSIRLDHLRVDLDWRQDDWNTLLAQAIHLAGRVGCELEVALFCADFNHSEWQRCSTLLSESSVSVARWLVYHPTSKVTPDSLVRQAVGVLGAGDDSTEIAVGTDAYFAELNRNRPTVDGVSLVCYSITPQVHAFDNRSLCETLGAQRWTVDTAHQIFDRKVAISPITLKPRFNPNATSDALEPGKPKAESDPRQTSGFNAAWTTGAIAQLATHPDVAALTFYETVGPRGIMNASGQVYPVHQVFQLLRDGREICRPQISDPLSVAALGIVTADGQRFTILANLTDRPRQVQWRARDTQLEAVKLDAESICVVPREDQE